jgi:L-lactate dehydrogenase complex protein LldE
MRIGLFVPCCATLELLGRLGIEVEYPFDQTCCGQKRIGSKSDVKHTLPESLFPLIREHCSHFPRHRWSMQ